MSWNMNRFGAALLLCLVWNTASVAPAAVIDFEELTLAPESFWNGPDPNGADEPDPWGSPLPVKVGGFTSGGATFSNRYNMNYDSWSGFAYSNTTDTITPGHTNQFSTFPGGGADGSANYAIAFGYRDGFSPTAAADLAGLPQIDLPSGTALEGAYFTNATYAVLSMQQGDSFAKKFGGASGNDEDWFKLLIYGVDADGQLMTDVVEFYLADFRFADNDLDYIVEDWEWVDLTALAGAASLYFNVESSDVGEWGMNTPAYFAIDNLTLASPVPEPSTWVLAIVGLAALGLAARRRTARPVA